MPVLPHHLPRHLPLLLDFRRPSTEAAATTTDQDLQPVLAAAAAVRAVPLSAAAEEEEEDIPRHQTWTRTVAGEEHHHHIGYSYRLLLLQGSAMLHALVDSQLLLLLPLVFLLLLAPLRRASVAADPALAAHEDAASVRYQVVLFSVGVVVRLVLALAARSFPAVAASLTTLAEEEVASSLPRLVVLFPAHFPGRSSVVADVVDVDVVVVVVVVVDSCMHMIFFLPLVFEGRVFCFVLCLCLCLCLSRSLRALQWCVL